MTFWDWICGPFGLMVVAVVGYAIGAVMHIAIDRHYQKKAVENFRHETSEEMLPAAEERILRGVDERLAHLEIKIPPYPEIPEVPTLEEIRACIPPYPDVPTTLSIPEDALAAMADRVSDKLKLMFVGSKGNMERKAQSSWEKIILSTSTGNPMLDGAINAMDSDGAYRKNLAKRLRKAGLDSMMDGAKGDDSDDGEPKGGSARVWKPGEWI